MEKQDGCIVQLKNVRKEFPGVVAVDQVSLDLYKGKVHALMGENGAGKSTIMKMLIGLYPIDGGEILYKGEPFCPNPANIPAMTR